MKHLCNILFAFYFILSSVNVFSQCDEAILPTIIKDNQDTIVIIPISGVMLDNLSDPLQGVCNINIAFTHDAVSDLVLQLTSPAGQTITLIGDINTSGPVTQFTSWNINFVNCGANANPDPGITDSWDNNSNWTNFGSYIGSYYPKDGCLEDFNQGPVNGNWILKIIDGVNFNEGTIESFGIDFCNNSGAKCIQCNPKAGSLTNSIFTACENDNLVFNLGLNGQNTEPEYSYLYMISQNSNIIKFSPTTDLTGLSAGQYEVCGISVLTKNLAQFLTSNLTYSELKSGEANFNNPICYDISENCVFIEIIPSSPSLVMNETICEGETITIGTDNFNTDGTFQAILKGNGAECDTAVILNLEVISLTPIITPSISEFICGVNQISLDASQSVQETFSTFSWTTIDGQILGLTTGSKINVGLPGNYILKQEEKGCSVTKSINIGTDTNTPILNINSSSFSCGIPTVQLKVSTNAIVTSSSWTGPQGFTSSILEPFITFPGRYFLKVTYSDGCIVNKFHDVMQGQDQAMITLSSAEINCGITDVEILLTSSKPLISYKWLGPNGFVSNLENPKVTAPGNYYLTAEDNNGCKAFANIEVFGNTQIFDYEILANKFVCNGGTTTVEGFTDLPNAVYNWTGPGNFSSTSAVATVSQIGKYYLQIIANGCVVRDSVLVERDISDLPEYDVKIDTLGDCLNPLYRVTAIPIANEFQTSNLRWALAEVAFIGSGTQIEISDIGNYFLFIDTYNGCGVAKHFKISPLPDAPIVKVENKEFINCDTGLGNGLIDINENSAYTYSWTGPNDYKSNNPDIQNLDPGLYKLIVIDTLSKCITSLNEKINIDTIPRVTNISASEINCNRIESNISLSVGGAVRTFNWEGPNGFSRNTKNLTVSETGNYFLTVTGSNGCLSYDTATVIANFTKPDITLSDNFLACATSSTQLFAQTNDIGLTYSWSGIDSFSSSAYKPTVFKLGTYYLTVTGLNGCETSDSLNIIENPNIPIPDLNTSGPLNCFNTEITIFGDADLPVTSYNWEGPNNFTSDLQNPKVSVPGKYYVSVTDQLQCVGNDSIIVDQFIVLPQRNFTFDSLSCIDSESDLFAFSTDLGASFKWEGPNGLNISGASGIAKDTGQYILTVTGSNNCKAQDTFEIGLMTVDIFNDLIIDCYVPTISTQELATDLSYNISWSGPNGFTSTTTRPLPNEEGTYVGFATGSNGCIANITSNISYDTIHPIAVSQPIGEVICEVRIINLSAEGSSNGLKYIYQWNTTNGEILNGQNEFIAQINDIGDYTLSVIDTTNGCVAISLLNIAETNSDFSDFDVSTTVPICYGEGNASLTFDANFGGTGPYLYSLDGFIFDDNNSFTNLYSGEYEAYVKDSFGCVISKPITINEAEILELELGENKDIFIGDEIVISANTNLTMDQIETIDWQIANQIGCSDCLSFTLRPSSDVSIELTLMNEFGCKVSDNVKVIVDQEPVLFKPNIFSPNNDGINDIFFISSNLGVALINSMAIFDRWGNKVFENSNFQPGDISAGWDGTKAGSMLLPGVYIYTAEVEMITGLKRTIRGSVTLIK